MRRPTGGRHPYVWATLSAAVYRQGTIVVDGKRRKIAVLDNNSNGRFDDLRFDAGERNRCRQRVGGLSTATRW